MKMKVEGLQAALFNLCINGNATSAIQDRKSISVSKDLNVSSVTFALIKLLHSVTGTAAGGVPAIYKYEAVDQEALAKLIMQYLVTVATEKEKGLLTQYGFSFPEPQPQDRQLCISSSVFAVLKEKGVFSAGLYNVNSDVFNLIFRLIIDVDDAANLKFIQLCVSYIAGAAEFISLDRAEVAGVVEAATVFNLKRDRAIQALQKFARTLDQIGKKAKGLIGVPPDVVQSFKMPVKRLHERFNEYRGMIDDADTNERVADSLLAADGIEDKTEAAQQLLAAIQVAKLSDDDLRDKGARRRDKITALARSLRSPDSRITLFSLLIQAYQRQNILPPAGSPDDLRKASIEQQRILRRLREIEAYLSQPVDQPGSADKFVQALKQEGQKSLQHLVAIKGSLELVPGFLERDDVALFSHLLFLLINRMEDVLRQPEANPEYLRNIDFLLNTEVELNTFFGPELDRSLCELFGINAELIAVSQAVEKVEQNIRGKTVHPEVKAEFKEKVEEVKSQLTKKFTGMNRQTVEAQALLKKAERVSKEIYTFFQSYFEGEHYALPIGEWMNAISAGLDQRKRLIDPLNMFLRMADQKKEEYLGDSDGRAKTPSFIEKFWKAIDEYIQSISGEIKARSEIESSAVERCTKLDQLISVKEDVRKVTPDVTQTLSAEDQAMVQRKREYVGLVGDEIGKLKFSMLHPMLVIEQHFPGQSMSVDGLSFEQWVDTLMALIQERMRDLSVWAQLYGVCALYHERYYDAKEAGLWEGLKPDKERKAALEGELPGAEAKVAAGLGVLDFTRLNWFVSGAGAAPQRELTELSVSLLLAEINRFAATHAEDCDWKAQDKFQYFWQYAKDLMPHYDFCLQRAGSLSEKGQAILEQYATIIP
ncbi:MAG: hypothetical protein KAT71_04140, partial [Gammaproteobacteria bacterium]|nr:hypothetical protein [Gammaproteobacteria bacterium]